MGPITEMTKEELLASKTLEEIFNEEDEITKAMKLIELSDRAKELKVKSQLDTLIKAFKKVERQINAKKKRQVSLVENWTNFTGKYDNMQCGSWVASDDGIFTYNSQNGALDVLACYHPILPIERLKNLETGEEQIKLAYKRNNAWQEMIVPKTMITSANKIVALSGRGISVTSENAKHLVKYLSDVENINDEYINVQYSSSKLGWIGSDFLPYDTEIIFDGDTRFKQLFDSIHENGNRNLWYDHVRTLRATERGEIKFMLAAAFASVLLKPLGSLPFFVDLWGETEGGKTVTLMLAASVWANPDESRYIGDFKTTDVALEAKADMLNHLPMILDDTSKTSSRVRDNFEGVIYDLCSGKGKSRSNKELGINRENRWKNVILTNGERPLNSYVNQGGAINRILEVECGEKVYQNPQRTAELLKRNYGFAGREFVQIIKDLGQEKISGIQQEFLAELQDDEKMQKQSLSLSVLLTADKIATEYLFKDGCYISIEEAKKVLIDRNEVSDNERCYHYVQDKVAMNEQRFDTVTKCEKWGLIENGYAIFYNSAFDQICREGGFAKRSFLAWATKKDLLQMQSGRATKVKKINGSPVRCIWLRLDDEIVDENGFVKVDCEQETIPFDC